MLKFIKDCYKKYGGIFQIQLFQKSMIVICDHELVSALLNQRDDTFSDFRQQLNIDWTVFNGRLIDEGKGIKFLRRLVYHKNELVLKEMYDYGKILIDNLHIPKGLCSLSKITDKFVQKVCYRGIMGMDLSENLCGDLDKYKNLTNQMIGGSFIFPSWLLKFINQQKFCKLEKALLPYLEEEIEKYREDKSKCDSILIRFSVDHQMNEELKSTDNLEVIQLIRLSVISLTDTLGPIVPNALRYLFLPENAQILIKLRKECAEGTGTDDLSKLLDAPLLNGCIWETLRLTNQVLGIFKIPMKNNCSLNDYHVGNQITMVTLSPQMLQVYGDANKVFHDPETFNPERFIGENPEPITPPSMLTWGSGIHRCPARNMTINTSKIILSQFILNFDIKSDDNILEIDYAGIGAFGREKGDVYISKIMN